MQYFYSPDGAQQHGPVDRDQLIAAGVLATTKVWREGLSGWMAAREVPELADLFVETPASPASPAETPQQTYDFAPTAPDPSSQQGAAGTTYAPQPHAVGYQQHYATAQPTNGMAIASMICGILGIVTGCFYVPSILAIVFGHVARGQIRQGNGSGDGMALAGLIMGYIWLAVSVLGVILYFVFIVAVIGAAATTPRTGPGPIPAPTPLPAPAPGSSSMSLDSIVYSLDPLLALVSQLSF